MHIKTTEALLIQISAETKKQVKWRNDAIVTVLSNIIIKLRSLYVNKNKQYIDIVKQMRYKNEKDIHTHLPLN